MGPPLYVHGAFMMGPWWVQEGGPCRLHGGSTVGPWRVHGGTMVGGSMVVGPWWVRGWCMVDSSLVRRRSMVLSGWCDGSRVAPSFHGGIMVFVW